MIKNILSFLFVENIELDSTVINQLLSNKKFVPCPPTGVSSQGFLEIHKHTELFCKTYGESIVFKYVAEKKSVPSSVVKIELEKEVDKYIIENGNKPSEEAIVFMKENIVATLLPSAFPKRSETICWIDLATNTFNVDTSSANKASEIFRYFNNAVPDLPIVIRLNTKVSPTIAMTSWLVGDAPENFTIDDKCELVLPSVGTPTIKYVRHDLSGEEIKSYLSSGRVPVSLSMTFSDKLSFTFTDKNHVKGIKMTKVFKLKNKDEEDLDASLLIMISTLNELSESLIESLDGIN